MRAALSRGLSAVVLPPARGLVGNLGAAAFGAWPVGVLGRTRDMTASVEAADLATAFVELTAEEADLVEVLCAAAAPKGTTVRICGGWVRDKALGRVCKDVDVAARLAASPPRR